jgi:hypothetical protein
MYFSIEQADRNGGVDIRWKGRARVDVLAKMYIYRNVVFVRCLRILLRRYGHGIACRVVGFV